MPHSIASISEKSLTVQGNRVPSVYPELARKNGVADRSNTRCFPLPILLLTANFYLALQISALKKIAVATSLGLLLSLQGVAVSLLFENQNNLQPRFDNSLMPLTFYLNKPVSSAEFTKDSAELFRQTDEVRQEPAEQ